ncbi:MAG: SPOR domain-containing protein [Magnetococcales bacterium]|nr:SPOR domain-containing protein [Magnetococcales bacterium]
MNPRYPTRSRYRRHRNRNAIGSPLLVKGMLFVLAIGLFFTLFSGGQERVVSDGVVPEPMMPVIEPSEISSPEPPQVVVNQQEVPPITPMLHPPPPKLHKPDIDLRFYQDLVKREFVLPPEPTPEESKKGVDLALLANMPEIKPAPPPVSINNGWGSQSFVVQLAAYPELQEAEGVARILQRDEAPSHVMRMIIRGRDVFQVRLGPYDTRAEAAQAAMRWKMDDHSALIMPYDGGR